MSLVRQKALLQQLLQQAAQGPLNQQPVEKQVHLQQPVQRRVLQRAVWEQGLPQEHRVQEPQPWIRRVIPALNLRALRLPGPCPVLASVKTQVKHPLTWGTVNRQAAWAQELDPVLLPA